MARHVFTDAERSRGGKVRAGMPDFRDMCSLGFWATVERHPFYARHWLRKKIQSQAASQKTASTEKGRRAGGEG